MSIDEARQNGSAMDVNYLGSGGNRDFATPADRLKPARLDNDDGVVERRPARAVDEFPAANHEPLLCHAVLLPSSAACCQGVKCLREARSGYQLNAQQL